MKISTLFGFLAALPTSYACSDNATFTFGTYFYSVGNVLTVQTCEWITTNSLKEDIRRGKWCNKSINGTVVGNECPVACLRCSGEPSSIPSEEPSVNPTNVPSSTPSVTPSYIPSYVPSHVPSIEASSKPSLMPSSKPSKDPSAQPSKYPSDTPSLVPSN